MLSGCSIGDGHFYLDPNKNMLYSIQEALLHQKDTYSQNPCVCPTNNARSDYKNGFLIPWDPQDQFLHHGTCLANSPAMKSCNPCLDAHSWSKSTETWFSMAGSSCTTHAAWSLESWLGRSSQPNQPNLYPWKRLPTPYAFHHTCIYDISVSGLVISGTRHSLQIMLVNNPRSPAFYAAWAISKGWQESPLANFIRMVTMT